MREYGIKVRERGWEELGRMMCVCMCVGVIYANWIRTRKIARMIEEKNESRAW